jgi:hypothetical protein
MSESTQKSNLLKFCIYEHDISLQVHVKIGHLKCFFYYLRRELCYGSGRNMKHCKSYHGTISVLLLPGHHLIFMFMLCKLLYCYVS